MFYVRRTDLVLSAKKKLGFFASSFGGLSPAKRLANATLFWALPEKDANAELQT